MTYQDMLFAIAKKLNERIAERAKEREALICVLLDYGEGNENTLVARVKLLEINKQISKLAIALSNVAAASGAE